MSIYEFLEKELSVESELKIMILRRNPIRGPSGGIKKMCKETNITKYQQLKWWTLQKKCLIGREVATRAEMEISRRENIGVRWCHHYIV